MIKVDLWIKSFPQPLIQLIFDNFRSNLYSDKVLHIKKKLRCKKCNTFYRVEFFTVFVFVFVLRVTVFVFVFVLRVNVFVFVFVLGVTVFVFVFVLR